MGPAISLRIFGIRIRAGLGTPVTIAVVAAGLASTLDRAGASRIATAGFCVVALGLILTLHEAVRIAVYRRVGVVVRGIDLTIAGGDPRLIDRTNSPRSETVAALAALAPVALLAAVAWLIERAALSEPSHPVFHLVVIIAVSIAVLQAMPVLPLDGGRLLRALVWHLTGDPARGTQATAVYGQLVALSMAATGTLLLDEADGLPYWGFALAVAGLQLGALSWASLRDSRWQALGGAVSLADADLPLPRRIAATESVAHAVDALIEEGNDAALLVMGDSGQPVGVVRLADLRRVRRVEWETHSVRAVMTPLDHLPQLPPTLSALDALAALERADTPLAVSACPDGRVLLVRRDQLLHLLTIRTASRG